MMEAVRNGAWAKCCGGGPTPSYDGLCFTAEEAGSYVNFSVATGTPPVVNLKYSMDYGLSWSKYSLGENIVLQNVGDKVFFEADGSNETISTSNSDRYIFKTSGLFSASGNVMSLLGEDFDSLTSVPHHCFTYLFSGAKITTPPLLPATVLGNSCYARMFQGSVIRCTPLLPADTVVREAYREMFSRCKYIQSCEILVTKGLDAFSALGQMFAHASSLCEIKIAYTGLFTNSFNQWVNDVSPTGKFYYNGTDTTRGISAIPEGWEVLPY